MKRVQERYTLWRSKGVESVIKELSSEIACAKQRLRELQNQNKNLGSIEQVKQKVIALQEQLPHLEDSLDKLQRQRNTIRHLQVLDSEYPQIYIVRYRAPCKGAG